MHGSSAVLIAARPCVQAHFWFQYFIYGLDSAVKLSHLGVLQAIRGRGHHLRSQSHVFEIFGNLNSFLSSLRIQTFKLVSDFLSVHRDELRHSALYDVQLDLDKLVVGTCELFVVIGSVVKFAPLPQHFASKVVGYTGGIAMHCGLIEVQNN